MNHADAMTGQMIFREAVGQVYREDYSAPEAQDPWTYTLGIGLVHTASPSMAVERVVPVLVDGEADGLRMFQGGPPAGLNRWDDENVAVCDLNGVLTSMQVASPAGAAGLLAHGGLFFRKTRFPGPEGTESYVVAAILRTGRGQVPERTMYDVAGGISAFALGNPRPMPGAFPIGSTPTGTLSQPIWGPAGGERSVYSTLRLDVIDAVNEIKALQRVASPSDEQSGRLAGLLRSEAGHIAKTGDRDGQYARFLALAEEMGESIQMPLDSYPTAAEIKAQKGAVDRVVKALLAEPPAPRMR